MLRIDERVLTGAVVGLLLVGLALGFVMGGGFDTTTPNDGGPGDGNGDALTTVTSAQPGSTPSTTQPPTTTALAEPPTGTPPSTVTSSPEPTPTRTPMLVRRFDRSEISQHLGRLLNRWRRDKDLPPYEIEGNVADDLRVMATNHSEEMADAGTVAHTIDGRSSLDRYKKYKLDRTCRFKRNGENWIVTPADARFELVGQTYAGRSYVRNGTRTFNEDEEAVARAVFEDWIARDDFRTRLKYLNATHVGVGVEITSNNEVYATANLCGVGPANEEVRLS